LMCFAHLANGTQKVGIIRNNDLVIFGGLFLHLLPGF